MTCTVRPNVRGGYEALLTRRGEKEWFAAAWGATRDEAVGRAIHYNLSEAQARKLKFVHKENS